MPPAWNTSHVTWSSRNAFPESALHALLLKGLAAGQPFSVPRIRGYASGSIGRPPIKDVCGRS